MTLTIKCHMGPESHGPTCEHPDKRMVEPLVDTVHLVADDEPSFCTAITSVYVPGFGFVTSIVPFGWQAKGIVKWTASYENQ